MSRQLLELAKGEAIAVGGTLSKAKSPDQYRPYFKCKTTPGFTSGSPVNSTPASSNKQLLKQLNFEHYSEGTHPEPHIDEEL